MQIDLVFNIKIIMKIFLTLFVLFFSFALQANEVLLKCVLPSEKDISYDEKNYQVYYFLTNEQLDTFDFSIGMFPASYRLEIIKNNKNELLILQDNKISTEYMINFISGWFKKKDMNLVSKYGTCTRIKRLNLN